MNKSIFSVFAILLIATMAFRMRNKEKTGWYSTYDWPSSSWYNDGYWSNSWNDHNTTDDGTDYVTTHKVEYWR